MFDSGFISLVTVHVTLCQSRQQNTETNGERERERERERDKNRVVGHNSEKRDNQPEMLSSKLSNKSGAISSSLSSNTFVFLNLTV